MPQIHADEKPGRRGATRAAYDHNNPMLVVKKAWDDYPQANVAEIQRRVRTSLSKRPQDATDAFIDYATANCIERIVSGETNPKSKPKHRPKLKTKSLSLAGRQAVQAQLAAEADAMLSYAKNAWRLEQAAPNGKALGDCTGTELSQFTGYYKALAQGVGPSQRLRDVKTGDDVEKAQTWTN